jgi:hypothetical protein
MKRLLRIIVCLIILPSACFAYTRDASFSRDSIGLAYGEGAGVSITNSEVVDTKKSISSVYYEKITSVDSSFDLFYRHQYDVWGNSVDTNPIIAAGEQSHTILGLNINYIISRNELLNTSWYYGGYLSRDDSTFSNTINPQIGLCASFPIFSIACLRFTLGLLYNSTAELAFMLPFNSEMSISYRGDTDALGGSLVEGTFRMSI